MTLTSLLRQQGQELLDASYIQEFIHMHRSDSVIGFGSGIITEEAYGGEKE